jgi:hypothetical protein
MEEDCSGSQGPQRTVALEKWMEKEKKKKKKKRRKEDEEEFLIQAHGTILGE